MCGIIGYVGHREALPIIMAGLERLEYRGYDSAGVAVLENGEVKVARAQGKLSELKKALAAGQSHSTARIGIGHTRWATHGRPSEDNAHPHTAGRVSLIHNGIIENYLELRERLKKDGVVFRSETDTEIAAHLLNMNLQRGLDPFRALQETCAQIHGSYAFVALDSEHKDVLLIAKNSTPLILGVGEDEMFVASDIPALLSHTRRVVILEDGDIAEVKQNTFHIEHHGRPVIREVQTITWDPATAQKGGYKHYLAKEIHEQGDVLADSFRGRLQIEEPYVYLPELTLSDQQIMEIERITLLACGTAWHAALVAKFYIETLARIPCEVDYASEFRYRQALFDEKTLIIAISQSGETADTLAAVELATSGCGDRRPKAVAICNVLGSSLARKVRNVIFTRAGPEISVASTKAFTTQLVVTLLLAVYLGEKRGTVRRQTAWDIIGSLLRLPGAVEEALRSEELIRDVAREFCQARDFLYLGRGMCYPIALEGALKLKEISYIHAEGYPAGEMKHGPIALIDEQMPVVVVLQKSAQLFDKTISNLKEVEARSGKVIAVTDSSNHPELKKVASAVIEVPFLSEFLSPILLTIPLQLLAYHVAVINGRDVDLPRNLAKSVTVE